MPARGQRDPASLRAQVAEWLDAHPGLHTCTTIADGLGLAPDDERRAHKVAIAARGLWAQGRARRAKRKYGSKRSIRV